MFCSYQAHVLDRIAVADVAQTTRTVSNPLSRSGSSANVAGLASPHNRSASGYFNARTGATPSASVPGSPGPAVALDAVDSELLHSLGIQAQTSGPSSSSNTPPESRRESRAGSRVTSRAGSRAGSRASSPERGHHVNGGVDGHKLAGALHSNRTGLFHFPSSMKPFTPFSKTRTHNHGHSHSSGHVSSSGHATSSTHGSTTPASGSGTHTPGTGTHSPGEPASTTSTTGDTLSRVPDYAVASRGFLGGGVTPLSRDLPSYDQAQQHSTPTSASTGDLLALARDHEREGENSGSGTGLVRPDASRRSTSDLLFMRSGGNHPSSSTLHTHAGPSAGGSQPVR